MIDSKVLVHDLLITGRAFEALAAIDLVFVEGAQCPWPKAETTTEVLAAVLRVRAIEEGPCTSGS